MSLRKIPSYFLRGALLTVPLALTLYIIYWLLKTFDNLLGVNVPGLGLVITLGLITAIGVLTSNVIGRSVFDVTERMLKRVPFVKLLYTSIKDLIGAFVGDRKSFDQPAAVRLGPPGSPKLLGFVTRDSLHALQMPGQVAVYVPQSYNFAGNVLIVPREQVELLDVPSGELMTFIVSGGVTGFGVGQSLLPPEPPPSMRQKTLGL